MSRFGKNIKKIRGLKQMTQSAFADLFDLSRTAVGAYEEGRAEPKLDTAVSIAKYFGISLDHLLCHDLSINHFHGLDKPRPPDPPPAADRAEPPADGSAVLVRQADREGYLRHLGSEAFLAGLPRFWVPLHTRHSKRAFELEGTELELFGQGPGPGDILVCVELKNNALANLREGQVHVVVARGRLLARRAFRQQDRLELLADNPSYPAERLRIGQLDEIWEATGFYSQRLDPPDGLRQELRLAGQALRELLARQA